MKLLTLFGAGALAAGTLIGAAVPAAAQQYRHGYHRAYGHYGNGYAGRSHYGYRHRYNGGGYYRHGWRGGPRWNGHRGYYRQHRYYR